MTDNIDNDDLVPFLLARLDTLESFIANLLAMMVALDPGSMAELRDDAFRKVSMVERVGRPTPVAEHYGAVLQDRARLLECALAQAGSPWTGTPVIDLAAARAARG